MSKIINIQDFMKHFFEEPNRWFHVREMARLINLNPSTTSKYLNQLNEEGILIKKLERNHLLFKANTESYDYKDAKILYNIKSIRKSGLIDFLDKELHYPEAIVVFGSYAKGENDKNSDIDIFAISNLKKELKLDAFEKKLKAKVHLFAKNKGEFIKLQNENKNLANSVLNGITVKGYLEIFA